MPKIRLILISFFGMFLLGCSTGGIPNSAFPGKKAGIRCGKGASVVHAECFEAQEKIQQARRKARRKSSDQDSWCGTACLSAKQNKRKQLLKERKEKKEYSAWMTGASFPHLIPNFFPGNAGLRLPLVAHPRRNMPNNAIRINLIFDISYFLSISPDFIRKNLL